MLKGCSGIVLGGESTTLKPGRSTKMTVSVLILDFNIENKCFKTVMSPSIPALVQASRATVQDVVNCA